MDQLSKPPATTARIPHLNRCSLECVRLLKENVSPQGVIDLILPKLLQEAQKLAINGKPMFGNTINLLTRRMNIDSHGWVLLHSIPRQVLESLMLRTVAYEHYHSGNTPYGHGYEFGHHPGAYVVAISIEGRQGGFLTGKELRTLYLDIERYVRCHDHIENAKAKRARPDPAALAFIEDVDTKYGQNDGHPKPIARFVQAKSRQNVLMLVDALKRAHAAAMAADPSGDSVTIQSPCYVGCTGSLLRRMAMYVPGPNKSSLTRVSKLYALTMSLIAMQNLQPRSHFIAAIRTWQVGQLAEAEALVSLLATSYVSQYGFNAVATGSSPETSPIYPTGRDSERYVKEYAPYFHQNVVWSLDDLNQMNNQVATLGRMAKLPRRITEIDQMIDIVRDLERRAEERTTFRAKYEDSFGAVQTAIQAQLESTAETHELADKGLAVLEDFGAFISNLKRRAGARGSSPDLGL
ncbi:hypothetical protein QR685DRAFT_550376 [Neurospora intermedia]|uniref:Uncharacterized protein n=1 Tax=Neurospora intermedia TaxID=5142 RepID=A0ABR3DT43_NEUIN